MMKRHFVYILKCNDSTLYTGYTTDLDRRWKAHAQGKGAKYTRGRGPFQPVYVEECSSKEEALSREAQIKKLSRKKKLELAGRCPWFEK